jgi:hypothetical protein
MELIRQKTPLVEKDRDIGQQWDRTRQMWRKIQSRQLRELETGLLRPSISSALFLTRPCRKLHRFVISPAGLVRQTSFWQTMVGGCRRVCLSRNPFHTLKAKQVATTAARSFVFSLSTGTYLVIHLHGRHGR